METPGKGRDEKRGRGMEGRWEGNVVGAKEIW